MDEELKKNLDSLIEALNGIEVSGRMNMARLLASIQYVEKLRNGELGIYVRKDEPETK